MVRVDNEDRIVDLKLKKIDLKFERDKYIYGSAFSFVIAAITFAVTSYNIYLFITKMLEDSLKTIISINEMVGIIVLFLFPFVAAAIAFIVSNLFIAIFKKSIDQIYNDRIQEIDDIITDLSSKKNSPKP